MMSGAVEEDAFSEFLAQDRPVEPAAYAHDAGEADAGAQLRQLVECAQRQEQLLAKVCSLLVGLNDKVENLAVSQERLEATMARMAEQGGVPISAGGTGSAGGQRPSIPRGSLVPPPGKSFTAAGGAADPIADQRASAEKMAAERQRIEEDSRRRAEELARKREEEEHRKREEAEQRRLEEERRREEERLRKEHLEKKTTGLMSNLITSSGGGLFGDEETTTKRNKGGLFDD